MGRDLTSAIAAETLVELPEPLGSHAANNEKANAGVRIDLNVLSIRDSHANHFVPVQGLC